MAEQNSMQESIAGTTFNDIIIDVAQRGDSFHVVLQDIDTLTGEKSCIRAAQPGHCNYEDAWWAAVFINSPRVMAGVLTGRITEADIEKIKEVVRDKRKLTTEASPL